VAVPLFEEGELFQAAVEVGADVVPAVAGVVLVGVGWEVGLVEGMWGLRNAEGRLRLVGEWMGAGRIRRGLGRKLELFET
jgi:hypothetical protein